MQWPIHRRSLQEPRTHRVIWWRGQGVGNFGCPDNFASHSQTCGQVSNDWNEESYEETYENEKHSESDLRSSILRGDEGWREWTNRRRPPGCRQDLIILQQCHHIIIESAHRQIIFTWMRRERADAVRFHPFSLHYSFTNQGYGSDFYLSPPC